MCLLNWSIPFIIYLYLKWGTEVRDMEYVLFAVDDMRVFKMTQLLLDFLIDIF